MNKLSKFEKTLNEFELKLYRHLKVSIENGGKYFKSKHIAQDLEDRPRRVGTTMYNLMNKDPKDIKISVRSHGSLSNVWQVEKVVK